MQNWLKGFLKVTLLELAFIINLHSTSRFESLTLSHNNMIALKPVLSAWLDEAEAAKRDPDGNGNGVLPPGEKKRKRTSIAAPEKRSLEAYFAVQPRPSGEKIAAIAEKLELKKNVVRVWFCNQRQKQKVLTVFTACNRNDVTSVTRQLSTF